MWGYLYPDADRSGTARGLATPTPHNLKAFPGEGKALLAEEVLLDLKGAQT